MRKRSKIIFWVVVSFIIPISFVSISIISFDVCSFERKSIYPLDNYKGTFLQQYNLTLYKEYARANTYRIYKCDGDNTKLTSTAYRKQCKLVQIDKGVPTERVIGNVTFQLNEEEFEIEEKGFFCNLPTTRRE